MRRVLIATGISATLVFGGAVAADAAPKNKPCVTIDEFAQVKMGNSKAKVAKIFGTKGVQGAVGTDQDGYTTEVRAYKVCKMVAAKVSVTFSSGEDLPAQSVGWSSAKAWVQRWERPETTLAQ
jgi:hypothetical protein